MMRVFEGVSPPTLAQFGPRTPENSPTQNCSH